MFMKYYKADPSQHVIVYRGGRIVRQGPGLNLWYLPHRTTVAIVPTVSQDIPFLFKETTANFQEVSIQGLLTFRFTKPLEVAKFLDFSIDSGKSNAYRGEDHQKPAQRVINAVQANTRGMVNELSLEEALIKVRELSDRVLAQVNAEADLNALGVLVERLHFSHVSATPEMRKALEADYREGLQKRADKAIYDRRVAAVEEERKIREREMATEIELENKRESLVAMQAQNNLTLAEAEAKADEMKLSPYGNLKPQALVGLALKEWAANAGTIGNLSITPDLLSRVVSWVGNENA